jgi:hypothetical protein
MNADNDLGSVGDAKKRGYPQESGKRISALVNPSVAILAASLFGVLITMTISKPVPSGTVGNAEKRGYPWESGKRISALVNSNVAMLARREFEWSISMTISKLVATTDAVAVGSPELQCKMWRLISSLVRTSSVAGLATS